MGAPVLLMSHPHPVDMANCEVHDHRMSHVAILFLALGMSFPSHSTSSHLWLVVLVIRRCRREELSKEKQLNPHISGNKSHKELLGHFQRNSVRLLVITFILCFMAEVNKVL